MFFENCTFNIKINMNPYCARMIKAKVYFTED